MIDLREYGYDEPNEPVPDGCLPARIIETRRGLYKAVCERGEVSAVLKGTPGAFPAVGDFVTLRYNDSGHSVIKTVRLRKSVFSRTDYSGHAAGYVKTIKEQVVAANFDYVFILSSLNRDFNINRLARYLTAARQSGGIPVVLFTKADLCDNADTQIDALHGTLPGVPVIALSAHTGAGLDQLAAYLAPGKTGVFLGMSGVGKSSLINALAGQELMTVNDIRESDARGRHTTTHRQLIKLPSGAMIIDTPGMRELGLWDAEDGINAVFTDVEAFFGECRFKDCRHDKEPGCAVQQALENGQLPRARWALYLSQKREAAFVAAKRPRR